MKYCDGSPWDMETLTLRDRAVFALLATGTVALSVASTTALTP